MGELRRLGKRGGYRLGSLGTAPGGNGGRRRSGRAPHRLRFGPERSRGWAGWWLAASLAGAAVIGLTAVAGLWFVPFAVGLVAGLATRRAGWRVRRALPAVLVMAALGWGAPLLWQAVAGRQPIGATARVIAALGGLPPYAVVGVVATLLVTCSQAAAGLWLGRAATPASPAA
jgi:hypothetical protein